MVTRAKAARVTAIAASSLALLTIVALTFHQTTLLLVLHLRLDAAWACRETILFGCGFALVLAGAAGSWPFRRVPSKAGAPGCLGSLVKFFGGLLGILFGVGASLAVGRGQVFRLQGDAGRRILLLTTSGMTPAYRVFVRDGAAGGWRDAGGGCPQWDGPFALRRSAHTARWALLGEPLEDGRLPVAVIVDAAGGVLAEEKALPPEDALRAEFGPDVWRPRLPWP